MLFVSWKINLRNIRRNEVFVSWRVVAQLAICWYSWLIFGVQELARLSVVAEVSEIP